VDLLDLYRGEMSPRKAAVLAVNLPAGARIWAALGSDLAWSTEAHMLANSLDLLAGANWQRGGGEGAKPPPVPRPGDEQRTKGRNAAMAAQAAAFRDRQRAREDA